MRILVVDDERAVADVIAESVRAQGHEAVVANGADEALEVLARTAPDAVILDLVMPGSGGIGVLEQIRQADRSLPVVIMTGRATEAMLDRARTLGVAGVLEKPFILTHLDWMVTARLFRERHGDPAPPSSGE